MTSLVVALQSISWVLLFLHQFAFDHPFAVVLLGVAAAGAGIGVLWWGLRPLRRALPGHGVVYLRSYLRRVPQAAVGLANALAVWGVCVATGVVSWSTGQASYLPALVRTAWLVVCAGLILWMVRRMDAREDALA